MEKPTQQTDYDARDQQTLDYADRNIRKSKETARLGAALIAVTALTLGGVKACDAIVDSPESGHTQPVGQPSSDTPSPIAGDSHQVYAL